MAVTKVNTEDIRLRKTAKRGTQLCVLVLGERGVGKSTFLDNLCNTSIFPLPQQIENLPDAAHAHISSGVTITTQRVSLNENNTAPTILDIVFFMGCGDNIDNSKTPAQVKEYLEAQFDKIIAQENQIQRNPKGEQSTPHVCIYFIKPTSRGMKDFDLEIMKNICHLVNIIPVISKADTLTEEELIYNKHIIMEDIRANDIRIFDFKEDRISDILCYYNLEQSNSAYSYIPKNTKINDILPFSLVCSNDVKQFANNELNHVRSYDWGELVVEDITCSDYIYLKSVLLGSHLEDLKDYTNNFLYERHRTKKLMHNKSSSNGSSMANADMKKTGEIANVSPLTKKAIVAPVRTSTFLSKELEEKNRIIEAYQRKINELVQKTRSSTETLTTDRTFTDSS